MFGGQLLAAALAEQKLPGVRFVPMRLTPSASVHKGRACGGVQIIVDDWSRFQPLPAGLAIACVLYRLYPDTWQVERYDALLGHRETLDVLKRGVARQELERNWQPGLQRFLEVRRRYLIYPD